MLLHIYYVKLNNEENCFILNIFIDTGGFTMKKLKDIFYDKNDILIALIIISVAAIVIVGRIDSILAYPASLSVEATSVDEPVIYSNSDTEEDTQNDTENDTNLPDSTENTDEQATDTNKDNSESNNKNHIINIEFGSNGDQIADILIKEGLIQSKQEFYNAVTTAGADTKLQAGSFIIPANSTPAEVVAIITR